MPALLSYSAQSNFSAALALELGLLVSLAYQDFKNSFNGLDHFKPGTILRDVPCEIITPIQERIGKNNNTPIGFIARTPDPKSYRVIFRGTMQTEEWRQNLRTALVPFMYKTNGEWGSVGRGFNEIYTLDRNFRDSNLSVYQLINTFGIHSEAKRICISGHSLGAALATLTALHLSFIRPEAEIILYTFASPRVGGGPEFETPFARHIEAYRIFNTEDVVTAVPPATLNPFGYEINAFTKARTKTIAKVAGLSLNKRGPGYVHVGIPVAFTQGKGSISLNHNMDETYLPAIRSCL